MLKWIVVACVMLGGCVPVARMSPAYFVETAPALPAGQVAVSGTAGGGTDLGGAGVAASGRVRVGVGGGQEVRVEGSALETWTEPDFSVDGSGNSAPAVPSRAYAARVSWKDALSDRVAVIAGAATAYDSSSLYRGWSVAGDLGLLVSGRPVLIGMTPYFGTRVTVTTPLTDPLGTGAATEVVLTGALGLAFAVSPHAQLFTEVGANSLVDRHDGADADAIEGGTILSTGPYAVFGLSWRL